MAKKLSIGALSFVALACVIFFGFAASITDKRMNKINRPAKPPLPSAETRALHKKAFIADLHADSLLWGRDLMKRNSAGHVDLPRLLEGHVSLQVFDAVTKTPKHMNVDKNDDSTDNIALLAFAQGWPIAAQKSLLERALYQARELHALASRSDGKLVFVGSRADLAALKDGSVGAMLGIEGAHALEGSVESVDRLFDAGYRIIGLAHFFDNEFAGSAHGVKKSGLGKDGEALIRRIEEKRMFIDLAHASPQTVDEVLTIARRPVIVSHTGVRATCDSQRNLSDDQLRKISGNAGIIGIGFWPTAVCGDDAAAIVKAITHAIDIMGPSAVALGSDFDGAVVTPFDAAHLIELTEALRASGLQDSIVEKVLGQNVREFFGNLLP